MPPIRIALALLVALAVTGCRDEPEPAQAPQPSNVQVGNEGVQVESGSSMVNVGGGTVEVTGDDGTTVTIDENGVNIPGLGNIAVEAANADGVDLSDSDTSPIVCDSSDTVVRNGVTIAGGALPAITASGSCTVVCNQCTLSSATSAIAASGSAEITLNGGSVQGGMVAIAASGSADVTTNATDVTGRVSQTGSASIHQN